MGADKHVASAFWVGLWKVGVSKTFITSHVTRHKGIMTFLYRCTDLNYDYIKQKGSEELISNVLYCSCLPYSDRWAMCFHLCKTLATSVPDFHPPTECGEFFYTLNNSTSTAPTAYCETYLPLAKAGKSEIFFQRALFILWAHSDCNLSKRVTVESRSGNLQSPVQGFWSSVSFFQSLCSWCLGFR